MKRLLAAVAVATLLFAVPSTTEGICEDEESQSYLCGYRCVSNSCINDAASKPQDVCWLNFSTNPVTCQWQANAPECSSSCGM